MGLNILEGIRSASRAQNPTQDIVAIASAVSKLNRDRLAMLTTQAKMLADAENRKRIHRMQDLQYSMAQYGFEMQQFNAFKKQAKDLMKTAMVELYANGGDMGQIAQLMRGFNLEMAAMMPQMQYGNTGGEFTTYLNNLRSQIESGKMKVAPGKQVKPTMSAASWTAAQTANQKLVNVLKKLKNAKNPFRFTNTLYTNTVLGGQTGLPAEVHNVVTKELAPVASEIRAVRQKLVDEASATRNKAQRDAIMTTVRQFDRTLTGLQSVINAQSKASVGGGLISDVVGLVGPASRQGNLQFFNALEQLTGGLTQYSENTARFEAALSALSLAPMIGHLGGRAISAAPSALRYGANLARSGLAKLTTPLGKQALRYPAQYLGRGAAQQAAKAGHGLLKRGITGARRVGARAKGAIFGPEYGVGARTPLITQFTPRGGTRLTPFQISLPGAAPAPPLPQVGMLGAAFSPGTAALGYPAALAGQGLIRAGAVGGAGAQPTMPLGPELQRTGLQLQDFSSMTPFQQRAAMYPEMMARQAEDAVLQQLFMNPFTE